jgi:hypothetical protein
MEIAWPTGDVTSVLLTSQFLAKFDECLQHLSLSKRLLTTTKNQL